MFTCDACLKRRLRIFLWHPTISSSSPLLRLSRAANHISPTYRQNHTVALAHTGSAPNNKATDTVSGRSGDRKQWLESRGVRPAHKPAKEVDLDFAVRKHLQYLKDPLKLAEHVRRCLREDDFDSTIELVRAASKHMQCIVSWNHLIEWQLSKGRMNAAIKIYNEMKKRAQVPDARTYTIIFSGCADHPDSVHALAKVMSIYQSMLTERSQIKPNTIHMNAVLKMCARAQDMEALFAIADQLPAKGQRAPNNLTYTTILNALRLYSVNDLRSSLTPMQKRENRRKALLDARLLWNDVINRWRQGDMWIDEELVCAMGRMLLVGESQDHDDIMSLIEQAMNVPRQVPRIGTPARQLIEPGSQGKAATDSDNYLEPESTKAELETRGSSEDTIPAEPFNMVTMTKPPPPTVSAYAKPGPNTLSLLMQCLLNLRLKEPATQYWQLLTTEHGVKPDADNYHAYLRILRVARASTETVKVVSAMPPTFRANKTFRIAMSTCERDKNNPNAFRNSGKILDIMETAGHTPDIPTLITYLTVATTATAYSKKVSSNGERLPSKQARGLQILRAISRLSPTFINLRSLLAYGDPSQEGYVGGQKEAQYEGEHAIQDTSQQDGERDIQDAGQHKGEHETQDVGQYVGEQEIQDEGQHEREQESQDASQHVIQKKDQKALPPLEELKENVLNLTRKLIRAHDIIIRNVLLPREQHPELIRQRSKLAAYVTRFKHKELTTREWAEERYKRVSRRRKLGEDEEVFEPSNPFDRSLDGVK